MSELNAPLGVWVPQACTLPTAERPLRLAEFDDLFAAGVRSVDRIDRARVRLELEPEPGAAARAADLVMRETRCCGFFHLHPDRHGWAGAAGGCCTGLAGRGARRADRPGCGGCPVVTVRLRSGQVAAAAGVNLQTLRYYERRGLVDEPDRTFGGHRLYPAETVTILRVIKTAQRLGFTLDEVADLLDTAAHRHARRADAGLQTRARAKLAEVEQKIADLGVIQDTLREAIAAGCDDLITCAGNSCCPLPFAELVTGEPRAQA
jgi:DNA-binding transcriptional MerR regulator